MTRHRTSVHKPQATKTEVSPADVRRALALMKELLKRAEAFEDCLARLSKLTRILGIPESELKKSGDKKRPRRAERSRK